MAFTNRWRASFPENPSKISVFKEKLKEIKWEPPKKSDDLQKLFDAVDDLADAELRYYFRRRKTRAAISTITRFIGWLSAGVGVLLPLIAATDPSRKDLSAWGFVAIATAASAFAANNLFGGTTGHVNFVQTQLSIESLIVKNRIEWQLFLSDIDSGEVSIDKKSAAFVLIKRYAEDFSKISTAETLEWRSDILDAMNKFALTIKQKS